MTHCRAFRPRAAADAEPSAPPAAERRTRPALRPRESPTPRTRPLRPEPPDAQKLLVIIVSDTDADGLVRALVGRGRTATKIGSTGGLLRRGNTTLLCGVAASEVDDILTLVRAVCPARSELLTLGALPFAGETSYISEPVEVRVGGAVVFVLNVERFERV